MRVFIGIEFPESIKEYLSYIQEIVINQSEKGNFIRKENFHLTLKFIGEEEPNEIEKIKESMDKVARYQNKFELYFNNMGYFPRRNMKIIWVGLKANEGLNQLYTNLEQTLEDKGFSKEERSFTPHITLGRQIILKEEFNKLTEKIIIENIPIPVNKISLMESSRVNGELTYTSIYESKLSKEIPI